MAGRTIAAVGGLVAVAAGAPAAFAQAGVSYSVPSDNPFAGQAGARPEIYSYGLRNPWRFSFDRATGDMAIADVGQDAIEEVDFRPAGQAAGANFGWNCFEGSAPFDAAPSGCLAPGHVPPAFEYSSQDDTVACSITGGYVVRDKSLPIAGRYVYGDFCTGELRSVKLSASGGSGDASLIVRVPAISSFGEDAAGRIYAISLGGPVFRLRAGAGPLPVLPEPVGVFNMPVYATSPPDDPDSLFVVEKGGTIKLVRGVGPPVTFLDISADTGTDNLERGLLSVAFAPDYADSGRLYVYRNDKSGDLRIEEFRRSASNPTWPPRPRGGSLLTQEHREFANHNGGQLQFGPDGYLYAALGDGAGRATRTGTHRTWARCSASDPHRPARGRRTPRSPG